MLDTHNELVRTAARCRADAARCRADAARWAVGGHHDALDQMDATVRQIEEHCRDMLDSVGAVAQMFGMRDARTRTRRTLRDLLLGRPAPVPPDYAARAEEYRADRL